MMDLRDLYMFRIVKENCYSESFFPRKNHHGINGLMWAKGEVIQIAYFLGGDLNVAVPIGLDPKTNHYTQHIWAREFRELTGQERLSLGISMRPGDSITELQRSHFRIPEIYKESV